jgi:hypothetical protein
VWVCARPVLVFVFFVFFVFTVEGRRFTDTCIVFFTVFFTTSSTLSVTPFSPHFQNGGLPPV